MLEERLVSILSAFERSTNLGVMHESSDMEVELYAVARLRSRFMACCWRLECKLLAPVHLFAHVRDLRILAWLCRGPIGQQEVKGLDIIRLDFWGWMKYVPSRDEFVLRFRLLLEQGCRIDKMIYNEGIEKSVWRLFLERSMGLWAEESFKIAPICAFLARVAADQSTEASYRYFLAGRGLSDLLGDSVTAGDSAFRTTILHESVLAHCYAAVEALTLQGFSVNALDGNGKFAIQLLYEMDQGNNLNMSEDSARRRDLEDSRIIALLEQNESLWDRTDFESVKKSGSSNLPLGWRAEAMQSSRGEEVLYREKHFDGITFKKPSFSLFQDQRLALGYRTVSLSGRTYHLDLLRFLQPGTTTALPASQATPIFTAQWYWDDIRSSDIQDTRATSGRINAIRKLFHRERDAMREPIPVSAPQHGGGMNNIRREFRLHSRLDERHHGSSGASPLNSGDETSPLLGPYRPSNIFEDDSFLIIWPVAILRPMHFMLTSNYLNLLLPLIPLSIVATASGWSPSVHIPVAVGALIPTSSMMRFAVHEVSRSRGTGGVVEEFDCLIELFVSSISARSVPLSESIY